MTKECLVKRTEIEGDFYVDFLGELLFCIGLHIYEANALVLGSHNKKTKSIIFLFSNGCDHVIHDDHQ